MSKIIRTNKFDDDPISARLTVWLRSLLCHEMWWNSIRFIWLWQGNLIPFIFLYKLSFSFGKKTYIFWIFVVNFFAKINTDIAFEHQLWYPGVYMYIYRQSYIYTTNSLSCVSLIVACHWSIMLANSQFAKGCLNSRQSDVLVIAPRISGTSGERTNHICTNSYVLLSRAKQHNSSNGEKRIMTMCHVRI